MAQEEQAQPALCANNCGFFGSAQTEGLCSSCYREVVKADVRKTKVKPAPAAPTEKVDEGAAAAATESPEAPATETKKKKRNRCTTCKKRVGLTGGFDCRCGGLFCPLHRYSDKHDCQYDYKQLGAQEIAQSNPVIMADKVERI